MYDDREREDGDEEGRRQSPILCFSMRRRRGYAVYFQARSSINIEKNSSTLARGSRPRVLYTGADRKREADTRAMMIIARPLPTRRGGFREIDRSSCDFSQQTCHRQMAISCLLRRMQIRIVNF